MKHADRFSDSPCCTGRSDYDFHRSLRRLDLEALGIEPLFVLSAVLGLCNSAYAATIKTGKNNDSKNRKR